MLNKLRNAFSRLSSALEEANYRLQLLQEALGRVEGRQLEGRKSTTLTDQEFRVFSQWGEDGILQFLLRHVPVSSKRFVEFGVQDYQEANTRFLLVKDNWKGLVLDGSAENMERLRSHRLHWFQNLTAVSSFVTAENINDLLASNGFTGKIGLLSVDIDGNDFWVWNAIHKVEADIVVCEYNYRFGPSRPVVVPYSPDFQREKAHYSKIYYGASLNALCLLADRKGYAFVGCNSNGVNAFFVRRELRPSFLKELTSEEGFIAGQFCDSHTPSGKLARLSLQQEQELLFSLPLVDVQKTVFQAVGAA